LVVFDRRQKERGASEFYQGRWFEWNVHRINIIACFRQLHRADSPRVEHVPSVILFLFILNYTGFARQMQETGLTAGKADLVGHSAAVWKPGASNILRLLVHVPWGIKVRQGILTPNQAGPAI
jgi:hypothetical protein